jgi:hypothetical protein
MSVAVGFVCLETRVPLGATDGSDVHPILQAALLGRSSNEIRGSLATNARLRSRNCTPGSISAMLPLPTGRTGKKNAPSLVEWFAGASWAAL